jgi:hypothetical protein
LNVSYDDEKLNVIEILRAPVIKKNNGGAYISVSGGFSKQEAIILMTGKRWKG